MGTGSFLGVKRPGTALPTHPVYAEVEEIVELYLYFRSGPSWSVLGRINVRVCNVFVKVFITVSPGGLKVDDGSLLDV